MKIQIIPAHDRYTAKHDWLESKHLFSFADYYDPANMHFGLLRVFNDDMIGNGIRNTQRVKNLKRFN